MKIRALSHKYLGVCVEDNLIQKSHNSIVIVRLKYTSSVFTLYTCTSTVSFNPHSFTANR
jgi:hypothetical protein